MRNAHHFWDLFSFAATHISWEWIRVTRLKHQDYPTFIIPSIKDLFEKFSGFLRITQFFCQSSFGDLIPLTRQNPTYATKIPDISDFYGAFNKGRLWKEMFIILRIIQCCCQSSFLKSHPTYATKIRHTWLEYPTYNVHWTKTYF